MGLTITGQVCFVYLYRLSHMVASTKLMRSHIIDNIMILNKATGFFCALYSNVILSLSPCVLLSFVFYFDFVCLTVFVSLCLCLFIMSCVPVNLWCLCPCVLFVRCCMFLLDSVTLTFLFKELELQKNTQNEAYKELFLSYMQLLEKAILCCCLIP